MKQFQAVYRDRDSFQNAVAQKLGKNRVSRWENQEEQ